MRLKSAFSPMRLAKRTRISALIGAAEGYPGPGFLVPTRNHDLLKWCLDRGLRLAQQMNLMTIGLYNQPAAAYLPSILY